MNITTYTKDSLYSIIDAVKMIQTLNINNFNVHKLSILIGYYKSHGIGINVI